MKQGQRLPSSMRLVEGNSVTRWRARKEQEIKGDEAAAEKGIPSCPRILKGEERREWERVTTEINSMGLLTLVDRSALEAYCVAYGKFIATKKEIDQLIKDVKQKTGKTISGLIIPTPKKYPMVNPAWHAMLRAEAVMDAFRQQFGLTAMSRSKIRVQKILDQDPFTAFRDRRNGKKEVNANP